MKRLKRDKVMRGKLKDKKVKYEYSTVNDGFDEHGNERKKVVKQ